MGTASTTAATHSSRCAYRQHAVQGHHLRRLVDFDLLETSFRIFDICYCAAGLLVAQFTNSAWRTQWISAVRTMVDAYGEVVSLVPAEVEAVWIAMIAIAALFVGISAHRDPQAAEGTAAICRWLFEQRHRGRP